MSEKKKKYAWPFSYAKIKEDFLTEIESIERCADYYLSGEGQKLLKKAQEIIKTTKFNKIFFIGNTFAYFASLVPKAMMMESDVKIPYFSDSIEISEFSDYIIPQKKQEGTLFIFISVSGVSRLVKRSIDHLKFIQTNPDLIWLITNKPNSDIESLCDHIFPLNVDSEVVLGTKTFFNSIIVLYFLACLFLDVNPNSGTTKRHIAQLISEMKRYRENVKEGTEKIISFLGHDSDFLYIISNGATMSAANLGALSAKSYCRFFAEAITRGLFFHGPFQIIDEKFRCILLAGDEPNDDSSVMLTKLVKLISDKLGTGKLVLLNNGIRLYEGMDINPQILHISFNCEESAFSPIMTGYILQFAMLEIAEKRGLLP